MSRVRIWVSERLLLSRPKSRDGKRRGNLFTLDMPPQIRNKHEKQLTFNLLSSRSDCQRTVMTRVATGIFPLSPRACAAEIALINAFSFTVTGRESTTAAPPAAAIFCHDSQAPKAPSRRCTPRKVVETGEFAEFITVYVVQSLSKIYVMPSCFRC
jgi:hypothetical protein